jgi:hypothetical protein
MSALFSFYQELKNWRIMEGKLKRIRFNKDGTLDFDVETEDGKRVIVKGCSLLLEHEFHELNEL